ncbi:MAG TPA: ribosome-associated translation inhibitor RaiA [Pseudacidobacterium sp.]|jgi:putative sigma-54 modulation protein|nr:ribosome-associated translation inhibitor RaiA [Pseudacidobacterium sp.]
MQVEYTGRQVTVTPALRAIADESIKRIVKILGKTTAAHVVLTAEKYRQFAEVTIKTRLQNIVATSESNNMETALREALDKAETQAIRCKKKIQAKKRQPKEEKLVTEPQLARPRRAARTAPAVSEEKPAATSAKKSNGNGHARQVMPVTVHTFPARVPIQEPHVVRSADSVAIRPMTLEEAVKEAEFRDREVFVFRDHKGNVKVLHRKRDGKMELIEAP